MVWKATAGGGGRGMRLAKEPDEFVKLLQVIPSPCSFSATLRVDILCKDFSYSSWVFSNNPFLVLECMWMGFEIHNFHIVSSMKLYCWICQLKLLNPSFSHWSGFVFCGKDLSSFSCTFFFIINISLFLIKKTLSFSHQSLIRYYLVLCYTVITVFCNVSVTVTVPIKSCLFFRLALQSSFFVKQY